MSSLQVAVSEPSGERARVAAVMSEMSRRMARPGYRSVEGRGVSDASLERDPIGGLDRELVAQCRARGPLRAALARIAARLVEQRAWERLSFARLSDYATERLGLSGRGVRSLAEVGSRLRQSAALEAALVSGTLGWTKVRLLARLPDGLDEEAWIAWARRETAETLSRAVRAVDRGSIEGGAAFDESARSRVFEVRCTPEVRWRWGGVRTAASRAAGRVLHISEAAELVAAEVLSALPIDERAESEMCLDAGESLADALPRARRGERAAIPGELPRGCPGLVAARGRPDERRRRPRPAFPPSLVPLLDALDEADPFEVDDRLRFAVSMEQRSDARLGPLLAVVWRRFLHRALGYSTRESYARERLGMDPTRARALVRLERLAEESEPLATAYRAGTVSWVQADVLAPLITADPLGRFVGDWVSWAGEVTVRRLRTDVEHALTIREVDPAEFRRTGGLPPEARAGHEEPDREVGATDSPEGPDREIGATVKEADPDTLTSSTSRPMDSPEGPDREIGATVKEVAPDTPAAPTSSRPPDSPEDRDREIGATVRAAVPDTLTSSTSRPTDSPEDRDREIGATPTRSAPNEVCWARFFGPPEVVQLFRAVLNTVRRRMERESGRLPTAGEALGVMLDHVEGCWGFPSGKEAARYKVFTRDGWRCSAPGCSSMQNLHDHHIHLRSHGGPDDLDNRTTLCAYHHLRGVHAGLLRCVGRAPNGLRWEMGIRPGVTPRMAYRSGDIRARTRVAALPRPGLRPSAHATAPGA